MTYTFRRAFNAMIVTSSTTSVAFLANLFGDLMPLKCFGIYAAIIIPVNFLMVVLIFPAIVTISEYIDEKCCFKIQMKKKVNDWEQDSIDLEYKGEEPNVKFFGHYFNNFVFKAKYFIILLTIAIAVFFGIYAA
jgi:predicted RND superfamily exporter protein